MRRRILLAILLAVAVTAGALGIPLGYSALQVVDNIKRTDLADSAQAVANNVDDALTAGQRVIQLDRMRAGVPTDARIKLDTPETKVLISGPDPGSSRSMKGGIPQWFITSLTCA